MIHRKKHTTLQRELVSTREILMKEAPRQSGCLQAPLDLGMDERVETIRVTVRTGKREADAHTHPDLLVVLSQRTHQGCQHSRI